MSHTQAAHKLHRQSIAKLQNFRMHWFGDHRKTHSFTALPRAKSSIYIYTQTKQQYYYYTRYLYSHRKPQRNELMHDDKKHESSAFGPQPSYHWSWDSIAHLFGERLGIFCMSWFSLPQLLLPSFSETPKIHSGIWRVFHCVPPSSHPPSPPSVHPPTSTLQPPRIPWTCTHNHYRKHSRKTKRILLTIFRYRSASTAVMVLQKEESMPGHFARSLTKHKHTPSQISLHSRINILVEAAPGSSPLASLFLFFCWVWWGFFQWVFGRFVSCLVYCQSALCEQVRVCEGWPVKSIAIWYDFSHGAFAKNSSL